MKNPDWKYSGAPLATDAEIQAFQFTASDYAEIERRARLDYAVEVKKSDDSINYVNFTRYYFARPYGEIYSDAVRNFVTLRKKEKMVAEQLPFVYSSDIISWLNSQPTKSDALTNEASAKERLEYINKAVSYAIEIENFKTETKTIDGYNNPLDLIGGRVETERALFYQKYTRTSAGEVIGQLNPVDAALWNEQAERIKRGYDAWGGSFLNSDGFVNFAKNVTAVAAVVLAGYVIYGAVAVGGAGAGAAGAATESGTLAGSTGLLSGSGAAASGEAAAGILTAEGLGTGAAASLTAGEAAAGSSFLAGLYEAVETKAIGAVQDAAVGAALTQVTPKKSPTTTTQRGSTSQAQSSGFELSKFIIPTLLTALFLI